jgi:hypothetical protein
LLRGSLEDVDDELRNQVKALVGIAYHKDLDDILAGLTTSERGFADKEVSLAEVHLNHSLLTLREKMRFPPQIMRTVTDSCFGKG